MQVMISKAIRLLALLAVLVMPFGMIAPAAAAHHEPAAAMPMKHCPDSQESKTEGGIAKCAMACSAALQELGSPTIGCRAIARASPLPSVTQALHGIRDDIATPPPKRS